MMLHLDNAPCVTFTVSRRNATTEFAKRRRKNASEFAEKKERRNASASVLPERVKSPE
jgi:replicative superfamily II helicase